MAILSGFIANIGISSLTCLAYNSGISINFYGQPTHMGWNTETGLYSGVITSSLPVTVASRTISGNIQDCWWDNFYNRVHINPSYVNVGNILVEKIYPIEVWSAYTTTKVLSNVSSIGTEGLSLSTTTPITFEPTEAKTYNLDVTLLGPSTINATYSFLFPSETPLLRVIGNRSIIWPFIPDEGFEEKLQWNTDIIKTQNSEQRLALRKAPRHVLSHKFLLNEKQFSKAKAISSQWSNRVYGLPVWSEVTLLQSGVTSGATIIAFSTNFADYRNDGLAVLWESDSKCKVIEISTVSPTQIILKKPLEESWGRCFVAPVRLGRTFSGVNYSRSATKYINAEASFDISDNIDLADEGIYTSYRGKPVLLDRTIVVDNVAERISRNLEFFDNGSGLIEIENSNNLVDHLQTISFIKDGSEDIWNFRKWLHARKGKQKGFWLPSWNTDIIILDDVSINDTQLIIEPIGYPLYYTTKDIMIVLKNGSKVFTRAVAGGTTIEGNEQLTLSAIIGTAFNSSDIDFACFLSYVRLDADEVTLNHEYNRHCKVAITVTETAEE